MANRVKLVSAILEGGGIRASFEVFDGTHTHAVDQIFASDGGRDGIVDAMRHLTSEIPALPYFAQSLIGSTLTYDGAYTLTTADGNTEDVTPKPTLKDKLVGKKKK
jgi:hypothetical protein